MAMFVIGTVPIVQIARAGSPGPACTGATYSVVSGDSWSLIASRLKVKMAALMTANAATTTTVIHPGQTLCLPANTPGAVTLPTVPTTNTTTTTTTTAPVSRPADVVSSMAIAAFPVQGLCSFTDTYGAARAGGRVHEGVDIIAKAGQWIYATNDGILTKQYLDAPGSLSGNGWRLTIADGSYFFYAHLSAFAAGVSVGSPVKAGQIIGQVGMTGNAPIPHLHFEVHPGGGVPVDPTPIVKAIDGCKNTAVPPQPDGALPGAVTPMPTAPTTPTTTADPATTVPPRAHRRDIPIVPAEVRPRRVAPPTGV
jgi:murein DD-endopeptidase MepM/ murein hydrolase activator NlpD